jgi:probable rRNA maturation factor
MACIITRRMSTFVISSTVKEYPSHPYEVAKKKILGSQYQLSLAFVGEARAKQLNQSYRKKDYAPNVLSFPLSAEQGEIIICPFTANREAHKFSLSKEGYIMYLFIHGLLHLKGYDHSDTMDKLEMKYLKFFNVK